jgi:hypothetical protein
VTSRKAVTCSIKLQSNSLSSDVVGGVSANLQNNHVNLDTSKTRHTDMLEPSHKGFVSFSQITVVEPS